MKLFFEYRNYRGHVTGYSDWFTFKSYEDLTRRAEYLIKRINEIEIVTAYDIDSNQIGQWGLA